MARWNEDAISTAQSSTARAAASAADDRGAGTAGSKLEPSSNQAQITVRAGACAANGASAMSAQVPGVRCQASAGARSANSSHHAFQEHAQLALQHNRSAGAAGRVGRSGVQHRWEAIPWSAAAHVCPRPCLHSSSARPALTAIARRISPSVPILQPHKDYTPCLLGPHTANIHTTHLN